MSYSRQSSEFYQVVRCGASEFSGYFAYARGASYYSRHVRVYSFVSRSGSSIFHARGLFRYLHFCPNFCTNVLLRLLDLSTMVNGVVSVLGGGLVATASGYRLCDGA